jgi:hypothetical protein
MQSGDLVATPLGENFHAAVVIVPYPPGNAKDVCLALDKPTETHALYASAHEKPASFNRFFCESHF